MQEYARAFYTGKEWKRCSRGYMSSKAYICERCGGVATICHHKQYITPSNITDPYITLCWDNLEALCQECHNLEHMLKRSLTYFDEAGNVERVKESGQLTEYKQAVAAIDRLLKRMDAQNATGAAKEE